MLREEGRGTGIHERCTRLPADQRASKGSLFWFRGPADTLSFGTQEMAYIPGYIFDWWYAGGTATFGKLCTLFFFF